MTSTPSDVVFRPGIPPESAGWPGGDHAVAVEDGVRIERNVAVPMRHVIHTGGRYDSHLLVPVV